MNQFFCIFAASYSVFVKQYLIRIGLVAFLLCATFLDSADGIMKIRLTPYYTLPCSRALAVIGFARL
ncbi:MAG: hypothetical protein J5931_03930 [Prevotella sp.]|nr:hypothetical protein [Prevotella sp.]